MEQDSGRGVKQFVSPPVQIRGESRQGGAGEWTVSAGTLPRLLRCRARLVWRDAGEGPWREEFLPLPAIEGAYREQGSGFGVQAPVSLDPEPRTLGCEQHLKFTLRATTVDIAIEGREQPNGGWEFSGRLTNTSGRPIELARFHYLDGVLETSNDSAVMLPFPPNYGGSQCFRPGQEAPPIRTPRGSATEYWFEIPAQEGRLPDPIYDEPNWLCSLESGIFFRNSCAAGWVLGATGPGKAYGEIGFRSAGPDAGHFYAGQLLDNILLSPGETRELERLLILAGDWQEGWREWGARCAEALSCSAHKYPLTGHLSWYRHFCEFTRADVDQAIEEFATLPVPPGGRIIQIDDGWERAPGDWQVRARFPADWWKQLPGRITASGSIPGLYFTPLTVLATNPIIKEHPEWFQRLADGRFAVPMMNWGWCDNLSWNFDDVFNKDARGGTLAYNLDPDHPGAREFMRVFLKEAVAAGWRAFKFDFLGFAGARVASDRRKTTFETQRDMWRFFRETVGPEILLNSCGHPWRVGLGYADSSRMGGDMVGNWTTMRKLLPLLFIRMMGTNGIWWSADPDIFYMRGKNSGVITGSYFEPVTLSTSAEEQSLLLTATGMMGGMLYTSDLPSEWSAAARQKVLEFWGTDKPVPAENPRLVFDPQTNLPRACKVERLLDGRRRIQCALFNWNDEPASLAVTLADLGLADPTWWRLEQADDSVTLRSGVLASTQPPHSARVAWLARHD